MAAGTTGKGSVHVIISSSGSTIDSVKIAELAKSRGAFVIGISNRSKSPLVAVCNLTLIASWPETPLTGGAFPSKISQLLIVDALLAEIEADQAWPELGKEIEDSFTAAVGFVASHGNEAERSTLNTA